MVTETIHLEFYAPSRSAHDLPPWSRLLRLLCLVLMYVTYLVFSLLPQGLLLLILWIIIELIFFYEFSQLSPVW